MRGILLINLGSPEDLKISSIRKYLKEFLSDEYVLDIPKLIRKVLVDFIIKNLSVFSKVPRKIFYRGGKKCQLMTVSRVRVGRISKTRGVLETSECLESI